MNKKSITILVVCLIVSVLSVSLAYYSARIIGDGKNVSVNAKELTINFDNNNEIASGIIEPGWSSANTFSVTNKSKTNFTYDIVLKNYKNTTKTNGYLVYKITSTNGYNMTEYKDMPKDGENSYDLVIARGITIEPGSSNKQSYTLEIKYLDSTEDQSIDMGSTVTGSLYIVESTTNENNPYTKGTLGYQIMEDNSNIKTRTDFSTTYTDVNIGTMYKAQEDNTDVYYFAGDARNNWVKFGTFPKDVIVYRGYNDNYPDLFVEYNSLEECKTGIEEYNKKCTMHKHASAGDPMYWRIIRTNSDGSVRLLYAGNNPESLDAFIGSDFYAQGMAPIYTGYMYGTNENLENMRKNTTGSTSKNIIDNWYKNNLIKYTKYLSTSAVYCNDRTISTENYDLNNNFNFLAYDRIDIKNQPNYNCSNVKDAFSVDNNEAKLDYPIALLTADEMAFAGAAPNNISNDLWFQNNSKNDHSLITFYTMTPNRKESYTYMYTIGGGSFGLIGTHWKPLLIRPTISLKKDLIYKSGDGSAANPYEIQETPDTISERLLSDKSTRPGERTDFSTTLTVDNTKTLYTGTEEGATVYYFAGNATDNWVKFGKNASNQDLYWRIIRTNFDGSIRLLYHGTSTTATDAYIGTSAFNSTREDSMYVGYMYGTSGNLVNNRTNTNNSTIKTTIDNWYSSNMTSYTKYLSTTAVYCNDREVGSGTYSATGDGFYYAGYTRLITNKTPSYDCTAIEDKFTVDSSTGNGKLTYPITLMTADEVSFAGGVHGTNAETWYYKNSTNGSSTGSTDWWLLSPGFWNGSTSAIGFILNGSNNPGFLSSGYGVRITFSIRPVISIKGDNLWNNGDGTASSPYEIVTD